MSNRSLGIIVLLLAASIGLVLTNPTMEDYVAFLEQRLVLALLQRPQGKSDLVRAVLAAQGRQVIEAVVRPNTLRRNYGLCSFFETGLLGERVLVLGAGGLFLPLRGVESMTKKIETFGSQLAE